MHIFLRNNSAKSKCENVLVFQIVRDCIELRFLKVHLFIRRCFALLSAAMFPMAKIRRPDS